MKPVLTLHPDKIEYRLFRLRQKPYSAISRIDYRSAWRTENIVIELNDTFSTFIGNIRDRDMTCKALIYLRDRGCHLSEKAAALIASAK